LAGRADHRLVVLDLLQAFIRSFKGYIYLRSGVQQSTDRGLRLTYSTSLIHQRGSGENTLPLCVLLVQRHLKETELETPSWIITFVFTGVLFLASPPFDLAVPYAVSHIAL
jgi:hypothetical protein